MRVHSMIGLRQATAVLVVGFLTAGGNSAHSAISHPDGSFEVREETHERVAAKLAKVFVDRTTEETLGAIPEHLGQGLSLLPEVVDVASSFSNGFLTIGFRTSYRFQVDTPLQVESREDFDALGPLLDLAGKNEIWTVRFFQSPETSRWHVISANPPAETFEPRPEPLWIENVNRQSFWVRTSGDEAEVLGGLIFEQYMPLFDIGLELQKRIPVMLRGEPVGFELRRLSGLAEEASGNYRLIVTSSSGGWDECDLPWVATPTDFALATALAMSGEAQWNFPVARMDRHTWRMTAAPWVVLSEVGMEITSVEESESQYAARMEAAEYEKRMDMAERQLKQWKWEDALEKDAAARRLWLAETDGMHMARALMQRRDAGDYIGGPLIEASLSANPYRPWLLNPHFSVDWVKSPIHDLRETGQAGSLRRFEFTVEAFPTGDMIPMEIWASFYLDEIAVERIEISSRPLAPSAPELGVVIPPIEPQTLFASVRAREVERELEEQNRPKADQETLNRIGPGLLFRRSPEAPPETRGPAPGTAPNTRPTAPQRRTGPSFGGGGCSSGRCG